MCFFCQQQDLGSVEHASVCRVWAEFGRDHLRLPYSASPEARRMQFLLLEPASVLDDRHLVLAAVRVAAAYRVHCILRRRAQGGFDRAFVRQALEQAAREAVQGHHGASSCYDLRWVAGRWRR